MQPSTDICTCNLNFLNSLLLFAICIIEYFIDLVDKHQLEDANILITKIFEARRRLGSIFVDTGLLGIAADEDNNNVFLYYTESDPLRNRVYKYQWNGQSLVNPTLILDLPAEPGPNHDGGKIAIGPDGYLYAVIGDLNHDGQLQNFPDGPPPDDTSMLID